VIDKVDFDDDEDVVVVRVRHRRSARSRSAVCGELAPGYDQGEGQRRWRGLDVG
jgi:hypothetical protein